jgi:hypothetical protein
MRSRHIVLVNESQALNVDNTVQETTEEGSTIPQFDVQTTIQLDQDLLGLPSRRILYAREGLMSNHEYTYLGPIDWNRFLEVYRIEGEALNEADSKSTTTHEFEDLANEIMDRLVWDDEELLDASGLDLGIISTVFALYAFKCYPLTSCRGHPNDTGTGDCPKVVFFAKPDQGPGLVRAAQLSNAGLVNYQTEEWPAIMVNGRNLTDLRRFSIELYDTLLLDPKSGHPQPGS